MWSLVDKVAISEKHRGVLQFFIGGTLSRLAHADPDRVGELARTFVETYAESRDGQRDEVVERAADIVAILWFWRGWSPGELELARWMSDLCRNEVALYHALSRSREGLAIGIAKSERSEDADTRRRCQSFLQSVVDRCSPILVAARGHEEAATSDHHPSQAVIRSAAKLLDHAISEIYFASGAFTERRGNTTEAGLPTVAAKRVFLREMRSVFETAARAGIVHTVHYTLETLAFLMPGDPALALDVAFAAMLDGPEGESYARELLGVALFVRMIKTSLADCRFLFDDLARRARLSDSLDMFLQQGWPEARKLLHELPDALR